MKLKKWPSRHHHRKYIKKTVWRIYMLMLGSRGLNTLVLKFPFIFSLQHRSQVHVPQSMRKKGVRLSEVKWSETNWTARKNKGRRNKDEMVTWIWIWTKAQTTNAAAASTRPPVIFFRALKYDKILVKIGKGKP